MDGEKPTSKGKMTWGVINMLYNGIRIKGAGEQTKPFVATQVQGDDDCSFSNIRLYYSPGDNKGEWMDFDNKLGPLARADHKERAYYLNHPVVWQIQEMFVTGKMNWSYDEILQHTKIFLAGFKSHAPCTVSMTFPMTGKRRHHTLTTWTRRYSGKRI